MIKEQKKLLILIGAILAGLIIVAIPIQIATGVKDVFPVFLVAYAISLLLIINIRSGMIDKKNFRSKVYNRKVSEDEVRIHKNGQKLVWITFLITVVIILILCVILYVR